MNKLFALIAILIISVGCSRGIEADLIVSAKLIWTGDDSNPQAEAMAIKADTILALGSLQEIMAYKGPNTIVEAYDNEMIIPGFIDAHTHFMDGGYNLLSVQLRDAGTPEEFIERIKAYEATIEPGEWILGGDWNHENWGGELPQKSWVDSVTANNPLFINRLDGHMVLVNSKAMELANVTNQQADIAGGTIVRDGAGNITGIFKDNARRPFYKVLPDPSLKQQLRAAKTAMEYVASHGVTSVHALNDMNDAYAQLHEKEEMTTRVYVTGSLASWRNALKDAEEYKGGDKWLRFGGVKGFVDGSLGSHTAAFYEPFSDTPTDSGFFVNTPDNLHRWIKSADSADLQVMVHAIGDRAIHTLLGIFEEVEKENGSKDRRFRIEHAQHILPDDFARFAELNIIASVQPYHAIDDGRWAEKVIGAERIKTTYAFKSLLDAGARVVFGSDWFVAPPIPLEGIYAAVTRQTLDGADPDGWVPEQKITAEQALRAYTVDAAYASFEEDIKGSLEPGKLADFVVLDKNILSIPGDEIRSTKVIATFVGGKLVFMKE
ncbi:amidohydrolase family protein [uncultured Imperialibacter sp.]|uniref:amidohydrolase n=1 Tax=uncultured Imperialibacter sp. TaxID=1672639 RepID=UPI0030DADA5C|tara:strand:- start:600 stop:2243 length:1644 start_codon:yes stop_codon:yes gene_type:complete